MKLTIDSDGYRTVHIFDDSFRSWYVNLDISLFQAYELLRALEQHRVVLTDLATNWYECTDCGHLHPKPEPDGGGCSS